MSLWTSLMWSHVKSSITPESSERDYLYSCRLLLSPSTKMKRRSSTVWFWSLSSDEKFFAGGQRAVRPDLVSQNSPIRDVHICLLKKKATHSPLLLLFSWRFLFETLLAARGENPVTRDYYQLTLLFLNERDVSEILFSWGFVWGGLHLAWEHRKNKTHQRFLYCSEMEEFIWCAFSTAILLHIIFQLKIYF